MKILDIIDSHTKDRVSKLKIAFFIMKDIQGKKMTDICLELDIKPVTNGYYYLNSINEYEKSIAVEVYENMPDNGYLEKLQRIKQLDKEIKRKEKLLTYVEVPSLSEPNIVYRFYNDGSEVKIKKRPKKDA